MPRETQAMHQAAVTFPTRQLIVRTVLAIMRRRIRDRCRTTCDQEDRLTQLTESALRIALAVITPEAIASSRLITSHRIFETN